MRRPITLIIALLVILSIMAVLAVNAQEDTTPAMQDMLPITEDVSYQVGIGDTADTIAAAFDISLECLVQTNNIADANRILVGDVLLISVSCPPYSGESYVPFPREVDLGSGGGDEVTYTVRVADTLDVIAFAFDVSVISLQEYNNIGNPGLIKPGQVLVIPSDAPPYGRVPPFGNEPAGVGGAEGDIIYTIQPRDTLDVIGAFYNAAPKCIAEANNITNTLNIQPRTTIVIPAVCAPYVGPNTVGGRILPASGVPTVAPTLPAAATEEVAATELPTEEATAETALPTPTSEVLEGDAGAGGGEEMGNIVDVASGNPDFSILMIAIQSAGLTNTVAEGGPFTVFAPTNQAFARAFADLGITADQLLTDTETLTAILTYHLLDGAFAAADVNRLLDQNNGTVDVVALQGEAITLSRNEAGGINVNDATVTTVDILASNGVIHVIDEVLLPPSLVEAMAGTGELGLPTAVPTEETPEVVMTEEAMPTEEAAPTEEVMEAEMTEEAAPTEEAMGVDMTEEPMMEVTPTPETLGADLGAGGGVEGEAPSLLDLLRQLSDEEGN